MTSGRVALAACALAIFAFGCHRKHVPVESGPELGYPACGDAGQEQEGAVVASGHLRSGPLSQEKNVVERYELRKTACGFVFRGRQEWPLSIGDVEVHYDAELNPTWAWKRLTISGSKRADGNADIRRYEMRASEGTDGTSAALPQRGPGQVVFIKHRDAKGEVTTEKLLPGGRMRRREGARVGAVIAPGRGVLTAWLRKEKLPVGGKTAELVLDMRDLLESLEMGTLERHEDMYEPSIGRTVRVYTFFGRETVFADETDAVIGDLAGLRPSDSLQTPEPAPLPTYGGPDPLHTP